GSADAILARIDLGRILEQTDSRTREILFLTLAEGCNHEEAGEVVGLTRWAVTKIVNRFQKKMREQKKIWFAELFHGKPAQSPGADAVRNVEVEITEREAE
ncbi:MAG TPA: hypothetical protein VJ385_00025, partial [Fibrobacteria bacterium]|nr:hypothetical protein [Fibrobacteria bacterium]